MWAYLVMTIFLNDEIPFLFKIEIESDYFAYMVADDLTMQSISVSAAVECNYSETCL